MTSQGKVLLVDPSTESQNSVARALSGSFELKRAGSVKEALEAAREGSIEAVLLETSLPDGDGFRLVGELRAREDFASVPILFYATRSEVSEKVHAFSLGADDYIVKPCDPAELKARVSARVDRLKSRGGQSDSLRLGDVMVNLTTQKAALVLETGPKVIDLTPAEFRLLHYFMRNENQLFSREQLLRAVWKDRTDVLDRTVDKHISSLRQKLGAHGTLIETVSGAGYRFSQQGPGARQPV